MVKLSVDLNEPKDSSKTDKAAQNGRTPLILEIHHRGWFTPTPSRSYISRQVSSANVVDIDKFCLHDHKDMIVKLGYGVEDLMYYQFFIPSLGLDYGLHSLNVDDDVLEMAKYIKDYKIILVYVKHGSSNVDTSIFVTPKKGVAIAVDNHLRKASIEIDSSPDVNMNLTPMCHRNLKKEWEQCTEDPFEELDDILGEYAHIGKQITGNEITRNEITSEITGKRMVVHVEGDYTMDSDSEDLDYDPKHDDVFDDDEHIVKEVHVNMNNFKFIADPKHDTRIGGVDVQDDDLDVIDYDSFGSDLDDGINFERRMQLRGLRRIGKQKIRVRVRCKGTIPALVPYIATDNNTDKNLFSQTKGDPTIREKINSSKQNILGKHKTVEGKGKKVNTPKKVDKNSCPWTMLVTYTKEYRWEVRTLSEDHTYIQSRAIKACTPRFLADHVIKSLATNPDIPVKAIQDQMQKQFEGLILAIASVFPSAEHMYCVRHIHENMKSQFKGGVYNEMLWNAAKATSEGQFKKKMDLKHGHMYTNSRPPKKRKKSNDEIASQSASSCKLSKKGKKVSGQAAGATNVSGQAAGAKKVSGQAADATNVSGQADGARKVSGQAVGSRKVSGQASNARKVSSQPSAAQSTAKQGPRQGFQGPIAGPASGHKERPRNLWIFEQY
uniref:GAF domain-containing protein n=1 Tax=Tanacetum cinerariifolium TaxID=118510 RepID=A0A6L2LKY2_TANCI|nr:GAF domain-containing protein [Tanacetum cinerariifolium]